MLLRVMVELPLHHKLKTVSDEALSCSGCHSSTRSMILRKMGLPSPQRGKYFARQPERIGMAQQHDGEQKRSGGDDSPLTSLRDAKLSILKMADTMVNVVKSISPKRRKEL